ncbi:MAG: hypothetical protein QF444_05570, partial [Phycisphaerales bacterium]|nr:hypothetical protein [Phycisphaerales bacterium]
YTYSMTNAAFSSSNLKLDMGDSGAIYFGNGDGSTGISAYDDVMPTAGEEVWDDSTQCNSCGFWLQEGTSSRHPVNDIFRKQSFAIIGVIVIIAFFWGLWRFF